MKRAVACLLFLALSAIGLPARAQLPDGVRISDPALLGGVPPEGVATGETLRLGLTDAIDRGLQHNLALLLREQHVGAAEGSRLQALSDLLPQTSVLASATRQKINLEAFGFSLPGMPSVVGPFHVFDGRVAVSQAVIAPKAWADLRAEKANVEAARESFNDARDIVVLVCGSLYLQAVEAQSRIEAAEAQLATARALHTLAADRKGAGLAPAIDVLRAQVQAAEREQQLIVARNTFEKQKLSLARAIGLPPGQPFELSDPMPSIVRAEPRFENVIAHAYETRADYREAQARVHSAEERVKAAKAGRLPNLDVTGDYGTIGQTVSGARATFTLTAAFRMPLFDGGKSKGEAVFAEAQADSARATLMDLRSRIDNDVRVAILDWRATADRVGVAVQALELAREQLAQAEDRFKAGVSNNLEVVESQEALASATDNQIAALFEHNLARASLARAQGGAEASYKTLLKGE